MIKKAGVFKKEEGMRNREEIRSYGDEKEMLEGDFYKPETPASPFFRIESTIMKIENKTGRNVSITSIVLLHYSESSLGQTIGILTGRSSSFEVFSLDPQEEKMISLKPNYEMDYKFGLLKSSSQLPEDPAKTYKADWYSLGNIGVETMIEIEIESEFRVSRTRNGESSLLEPQEEAKVYRESEKNTDTNWESFMERRGTYRQEGPIFLSYTRVRGSNTISELGEELKTLVEKGIIRWTILEI